MLTGRAIAGSDPTNQSGYKPEMGSDTVNIIAPGAPRLPDMDDLFSLEGLEETFNEFGKSMTDAQNGPMAAAFKGAQRAISEAEARLSSNTQAYYKDMQNQLAQAGLVKSLATAMFGGASFQQAIQGEVQNRINGAISGAIAEATGLDPGLVSAVYGGYSSGMSLNNAIKSGVQSFAENKMWEAAGEAIGNPELVNAYRQHLGAQQAKKEKAKADQQQKIQMVATAAAVGASATGMC